jgi:glycosyltransferase involved in cell wall biosynthesis
MKVCVVTSNTAASEPRAPRHAIAAKLAFPDAEVVLVDLLEAHTTQRPDPLALRHHGVTRKTLRFPTRKSNLAAAIGRKARTALGRALFKGFGTLSDPVFGERGQGFADALRTIKADLYIAHNADTLYPAIRAARRDGAGVVFDCMEFYSEMGDAQSSLERDATRLLEERCLKSCVLVIASSDTLADALVDEYGIRRPLPAYNTPPKTDDLAPRRGGGLNLYWRNNVVDLGQRGLHDALVALSFVPPTVHLSIQGHQPADGGLAVRTAIEALGLNGRVSVLPPFAPEEAVRLASAHDVGLCLERSGPRNHELTVSNKLFDYHMAGLAVVASDMPSLSQVLARSGGGLTYAANDPRALADAILRLHQSPQLLTSLQANARRFAMDEANMENELARIAAALQQAVAPPSGDR